MVECVQGKCDLNKRVEIPCDTRCAIDADCVLADKGCCCGTTVDDYVAILQEDLPAWLNREECQDVDCPFIECEVPQGLKAVCQNHQCALDVDVEHWDLCDFDEETTYTYRELDDLTDKMAGGLKGFGVKIGDRVALLSENRLEWALTDLGILCTGAVTVPIYPTLLPDTIE